MKSIYALFYLYSLGLFILGVTFTNPLTVALSILIFVHISFDIFISKLYDQHYDKRTKYHGISSIVMGIGYLFLFFLFLLKTFSIKIL